MDKFVHQGNLKHYRKLLADGTHEPQRQQILMLLAEEEAKDRVPVPFLLIAHGLPQPAARLRCWFRDLTAAKTLTPAADSSAIARKLGGEPRSPASS